MLSYKEQLEEHYNKYPFVRCPRRGEVFYADLGQGKGSEQQGSRPVLIVSSNKGNRTSGTVLVTPLTHNTTTALSTHSYWEDAKGEISVLKAEQTRAISKLRLSDKVGELTSSQMEEVNKTILVAFGLL